MVDAAAYEVNRILDDTPAYSPDEALCREIDRLYEIEVERRLDEGA